MKKYFLIGDKCYYLSSFSNDTFEVTNFKGNKGSYFKVTTYTLNQRQMEIDIDGPGSWLLAPPKDQITTEQNRSEEVIRMENPDDIFKILPLNGKIYEWDKLSIIDTNNKEIYLYKRDKNKSIDNSIYRIDIIPILPVKE